jgi:enduracididine beta-hydroxylase
MLTVEISEDDARQMRALARELASTCGSVEDDAFLAQAPVYAHELPRGVRRTLADFRLREPAGLCLLRGLPLDETRLGPTPAHWKAKPHPSPTLEEDILFFLAASLLGDPVGWSTQQEGYILHDILPIVGHEKEQLGSGSETLLTWHTEDAFHPFRTDYIGLMCLRNPDGVETTYASMDDVRLTESLVRVLFQERFTIRPDESHLARNRGSLWRDLGASDELVRRSCAQIEEMDRQPPPVAVLFGDPASPYVRLDPYFMRRPDDEEAAQALDALVSAIDARITGVALRPGDILFIDNFRAVHGRKPFHARHDGTDRWLRRLNVARDLRKSRSARPRADCRVIF